jgi:hypothetical protein
MVKEIAIKNSFLKIKKEIELLKKENLLLKQEISSLKNEMQSQYFADNIAEKIAAKINQKNMGSENQINKIPNRIEPARFIKEKIKSKIAELCIEKKEPGIVKNLIVDKKKLCSKATFYRYVNELLKEQVLQRIELNNQTYLINTNNIYNRT